MKSVSRRKCRLPLPLFFCLLLGISSVVITWLQHQYHNEEFTLPTDNDFLLVSTSSNGPATGLNFGTFSLTVHNETYRYRYSSQLLPKSRKRAAAASSTPTIAFGILSAPGNWQARQAIRDSWGKDETIFFVLGGELYTAEMDRELHTYQDIVVLEAPEDYRSGLTRKTMLIIHLYHHLFNNGYDASTTRCLGKGDYSPSCQYDYNYLFKTDDDSYVNTTQLRIELSGKDPKTGEPISFYGEPSVKTEPDRNTSSRFYISLEEYSGKVYPPYAFGMGYALSAPLASCVCHQMTKVRKQLPWEDVATGSLVRKCKGKLTWANWSLPGYPSKFQVQYFPYNILKPGGFSVTLVHGVKNPQWMSLLHHQLPLP